MAKITIQDLSSALSQKQSCSKMRADKFLRLFFNTIKNRLETDGYVKVKGLGTFKMVTVGSRESVDVNSGERIEISEHQRLLFVPDKWMKERINRPFGKFETVVIDDELVLDGEEKTEEPISADAIDENDEERLTPEELQAEKDTSTTRAETTESSPTETENKEESVQSLFIGEEQPLEENEQEPESTEGELAAEEMAADPDDTEEYTDEEEADDDHHRNGWAYVGLVLCGLLLLAGGYAAGHFHLLIPAETHTIIKYKTLVKRAAERPDSVTLKEDSIVQEQKQWEAQAAQYEQLAGGEYIIIGVLGEYPMGENDTLWKIARKTYGDKKFADYIVFFNKLKNQDVVPLGMKLQLPQLAKRNGETLEPI